MLSSVVDRNGRARTRAYLPSPGRSERVRYDIHDVAAGTRTIATGPDRFHV